MSNFPIASGDLARRYLLFLNDPLLFARRHSLARTVLMRELVRIRSDVERATIHARKEIREQARRLLRAPILEELAEERTWDPRERRRFLQKAAEQLAAGRPQLHAIARGLARLPGGSRRTIRDVINFEKKVIAKLNRLLPPAKTYPLERQTVICPRCQRAFFRPPKSRAQKYCPNCRRLTKSQLWYWSTKQPWYQKRGTPKKKGGKER